MSIFELLSEIKQNKNSLSGLTFLHLKRTITVKNKYLHIRNNFGNSSLKRPVKMCLNGNYKNDQKILSSYPSTNLNYK